MGGEIIADGLAGEGAALNAIVLAELYVGQDDRATIEVDLHALGIHIVDVPAATAVLCARAYSRYRLTRRKAGGGDAPKIPSPTATRPGTCVLSDRKRKACATILPGGPQRKK